MYNDGQYALTAINMAGEKLLIIQYECFVVVVVDESIDREALYFNHAAMSR